MKKKLLTCAALMAVMTPAQSCPSCQCGDYTLTLMGVEKNYAGRTRLALDYQHRSEYQGEGIGRTLLEEDRTVLGVSYAFSETLSVALRLPFSTKQASADTLANEQASGLGDAEVVGKYTIGSTGELTARHLWGLQAGLRVPTSSEQKDGSGQPIDIDAQPGTGAWSPSVGVWYGYFRFPRMLYTSLVYMNGDGSSYQGLNQGAALLGTLTAQQALDTHWSLQLSLETRHAERNRFSGGEDGDSGGHALFAAPGVLWSPHESWLIHVSAQLPLVQNLYGEQDERGDIRVGIAYDLAD